MTVPLTLAREEGAVKNAGPCANSDDDGVSAGGFLDDDEDLDSGGGGLD